jgi:hypothetical protein
MKFTVENITDSLSTTANIPNACSAFSTVPFSNVNWKIDYFPTWIPDLVFVHDARRKLATTISDPVSGCNGGQNNFFIPGDLILGGNMLKPDGYGYKVDFEMTHLSLHIPITDAYGSPLLIDGYSGLLLFDTFVAEEASGKTTSGFNAMKYADSTYIQQADFGNSKVKIVPSIQSTSNSYSTSGANINDIVGLNYDPSTSLMTLYMADGYESTAQPAIRTKVLVEVYMKKAGFVNSTQSITDDEMRALLST